VIVLDTNVISELIRPDPSPDVLRWVAGKPLRLMHITAVTEAEIRHGFALMPEGVRQRTLAEAFKRFMAEGIGDRVLPFDAAATPHYAAFMAARRQAGRPVAMADAQIAAIARARGAVVLATRNTTDFKGCGVALADPWREGA